MNYLKITSQGEIDTEAFTLLGASTKRGDDTKIGLYGSGNKYAIASMLRNNINFKVFSGENEIVFTTKKTKFRDKEFDLILVNGKETSLTADMGGKDWDSAFAPIREIYSNALDEDEDAQIKKVNGFDPKPGETAFFIESTPEVSHFYKNVELYFCTKNPNVLESSSSWGSIYKNKIESETRVFRKGILAHYDSQFPALFSYNLNEVEINESRVIRSKYEMYNHIAYVLKKSKSEQVINAIIEGLKGSNNGILEHHITWDAWADFSEVWLETLQDKKFYPLEYVNMFEEHQLKDRIPTTAKLLAPLLKQFPDLDVLGMGGAKREIFVEAKPNQILLDKVLDALAILQKTRYAHRMEDLDIRYVNFHNESIEGYADKGVIYLSNNLDSQDVSSIAKIIIEENEHNRTSYEDRSRVFQNHLFNLYYDELISK